MRTLVRSGAMAVISSCALANPVIISDSDFVGPQWSSTVPVPFLQVGDCGHTDTPAIFRRTLNGISGPYLELSVLIGNAFQPCSNPLVVSQVFHAYTGATYDPAVSGAIQSIKYSDTRRLIAGSANTSIATLHLLALRQGGNVYVCRLGSSDIVSSVWTNVSFTGLTSADFSANGFTPTPPNFSATGQPIQFGIFQFGNGTGLTPRPIAIYIDNFRVEITPAAIPCPSDLNNDDFVDDADFVIFATAYETFTVPPANPAADLNGDTFIDDADFVIFADAYESFVCP